MRKGAVTIFALLNSQGLVYLWSYKTSKVRIYQENKSMNFTNVIFQSEKNIIDLNNNYIKQ